jgi:methyl-accepting chemotaxis protein
MASPTNTGAPPALHSHVQSLADDIAELRDLSEVFERWHQDMIGLTASNRSLHSKGEDLVGIARSLIMVSLNAAIEAARAGDSARGFVAVAAEVRSLALKAQELANELRAGLNKNTVLTVSTFQDIQAGGKLMIAAVSGLGSSVSNLRGRIE